MKTVKNIMEKWLPANGYDGLAGDECGCVVGDLCPCGEGGMDCVPGHKVNPPPGADHEGNDHDYYSGDVAPQPAAMCVVGIIMEATGGRCGKCDAKLEQKIGEVGP